ncbi:TerC family protein [Vulgatibacter sp.]|uniref:TerC family protein n=1 Tax=Vulgatibacter sp. TaxID=1971226 RepID=UPI0035635944
MLEAFTTAEGWIALASLSAMEIVLGIDNIIFISILVAKLPVHQQAKGRQIGLALALLMRLGLLFAIAWIMRLTAPLFTVLGNEISGRDLILVVGGLFLIAKATYEIHDKLEVDHEKTGGIGKKSTTSFTAVLLQIIALDIVFSLDSVITAVGMAPAISIMVVAMVLAVGVMLVFAGPIGNFVERNPTMKILALSFLLLIGVVLVADGLGQHISKGYIYFSIAFSLLVELINMRLRKVHEAPVRLHGKFEHEPKPPELAK